MKIKITFIKACIFLLTSQIIFAQVPVPTVTWASFADSVNCFGSPNAADLNNDGILDIVVGCGIIDSVRGNGVIAFNGENGNILWSVKAITQMFTTARFLDITGDNIPEAFVAGRHAQFFAINGANGNLIWNFYPEAINISPDEDTIFNFYTPQLIPDQNNDGFKDFLISNGGNHYALPFDSISRPPGRLMIISSKDGALLANALVPDGQETYMSPLVYDMDNNGILDVIYGTGGEVFGGSLWKAPLPDVMNQNLANSVQIVHSSKKGFIAPPALADLNNDGTMDYIAAQYNGKLIAINGKTNTELWNYQQPGTETLAAPAIGRFTDDYTPDVFAIIATGQSPTFTSFKQVMIDGATGQVKYSKTQAKWSFASPLAIDLDKDFHDEALIVIDSIVAGSFKHQFRIIDFNDNNSNKAYTPLKGGFNLASTPLIIDANNDAKLDLFYTHAADSTGFSPINGIKMERLNLKTYPKHLAWTAYMGNKTDGIYNNPFQICDTSFAATIVHSSPCFNENNGSIKITINKGTPLYTYKINETQTAPTSATNANFASLEAGSYTVIVNDGNGCTNTQNIALNAYPEIQVNANITNATNNTSNNGSIQLITNGGGGNFSYIWNTVPIKTAATINNLSTGCYTVTIEDANNCKIEKTYCVDVTGINQLNNQASISVQVLNQQLHINTENAAIQQITLLDMLGRIVLQKNINNNNHTNQQIIPLLSHFDGIYLLQVQTTQGNYISKIPIVKQ